MATFTTLATMHQLGLAKLLSIGNFSFMTLSIDDLQDSLELFYLLDVALDDYGELLLSLSIITTSLTNNCIASEYKNKSDLAMVIISSCYQRASYVSWKLSTCILCLHYLGLCTRPGGPEMPPPSLPPEQLS